ncbi:hypothetical protein NM69155_2152 [Neisseria meningitidis 69155]|nr:hypothetical protein NM69155_2152 [Neisseria meningitidis 69155]
MIVEVVAQLEQGAFVYPFLRVGLGARNPCGYIGQVLAGSACIGRVIDISVVFNFDIALGRAVFGFFAEAAGINQ